MPVPGRRPAPPRRCRPEAIVAALVALFVAAPVMLAQGPGHWPGHRGYVSELSSALGIVALGLLAMLLVLPTRVRPLQGLGADLAVRLHRRVVSCFVWVLAAHVGLILLADPARLALLRFAGAPWRAQAAMASVVAFGLLAGTSLGRRRLRLDYVAWRRLHVGLAAVAMLLAIAHTVGWDRYLMHGTGVVALAGLGAAPLLAIISLRVNRQRRLRCLPYVVEAVRREQGEAVTLQLRAVGHPGQAFVAGQFAWIRTGDGRSIDEHPFSYSSSAARPYRPAFTIRAYAGFTAAAQALPVGTRVLVDGPHGSFRPRRNAAGIAMIATGIGITPMMSMLRTAVDGGDRRRFVLVYGTRDGTGVTFDDELRSLAGVLDLEVHHVHSRPTPGWDGLRGRIDREVLRHALPPDLRHWDVFVCGSGAAVDGSLLALTAAGIHPEHVHAERFVEV